MSEDDLTAMFDECLERLPSYAKRCIRGYTRSNGIQIERGIDDQRVDQMQNELGAPIPAAGTLFEKDCWRFVFRQKLLEAPPEVVRPIIIHELIHAFIRPILHPVPGDRPIELKSREWIITYREEFNRDKLSKPPYPAGCDYEELLVTWIGLRWKTGEDAAHAWVNSLK